MSQSNRPDLTRFDWIETIQAMIGIFAACLAGRMDRTSLNISADVLDAIKDFDLKITELLNKDKENR